MRYSVLAIVIAIYWSGCSSGNQEEKASTTFIVDSTAVEKPVTSQKISGSVADSMLALLCRRWYSKKIVINGIEDNAEYNTNNEELNLFKDMTYNALDHDEGDSLAGTWQITNAKTFRLTDGSGNEHNFEITTLSSDSLITKVLDSEDQDISIQYGSKE